MTSASLSSHQRRQINAWLRHWGKPTLTDTEAEYWADDAVALTSEDLAEQVIERRRRLLRIKPTGDSGPMSRDVSAWVVARSLMLAALAAEDEWAADFRAGNLADGLIELEEVEGWITDRLTPIRAEAVVIAPADWDGISAFRFSKEDVVGLAPDRFVAFPAAGSVGYLRVSRGTVLDELRLLSERLASRFQWQPAQATAWVLCGGVPLVQVIAREQRTAPNGPDKVTVTADPDTPVEVVAATFSEARSRMRGPKGRLPSTKVLELVTFAEERAAMPIASIHRAWNRARPDDAYSDRRAFAQALRDGRRRVLGESKPRLSGRL